MKSKIIKTIYLLLGLQILSYCFIGDFMLEYEIKGNFESFNERKLLNPYNKKVIEQYYFSSCGDEFFRDPEPRDMFFENEGSIYFSDTLIKKISTISYHQNIGDILDNETDEKKLTNCILYRGMSFTKSPVFVY